MCAVIVTLAVAVPVSIVTTTNNLSNSDSSVVSEGQQLCSNARPTSPRRAATNAESGLDAPGFLLRNAKELYTGNVEGIHTTPSVLLSHRTRKGHSRAEAPRSRVLCSFVDGIQTNVDIRFVNGVIVAIGKNLTKQEGDSEIDVSGKYITPGLVDLHRCSARCMTRVRRKSWRPS